MADFNQVLDPGSYQSGVVNTVVEISEGSTLKIEWDRKRAAFMLDRVESAIFANHAIMVLSRSRCLLNAFPVSFSKHVIDIFMVKLVVYSILNLFEVNNHAMPGVIVS